MNKDDKIIMAVKRDILFNSSYFQGFSPHSKKGCYESRIIENHEWLRRGDIEEDSTWKQPMGYGVILNQSKRSIYTYQRSVRDDHYKERRLQGKWSIGVGGHIEKRDLVGNPIWGSMLRELEEEVTFINAKESPSMSVIGYINDDSNPVGMVHFGILYLIKTDADEVLPKGNESSIGRLRTLRELEEIFLPSSNVEGWSRIALTTLKPCFLEHTPSH